jgi:hypothetical protein
MSISRLQILFTGCLLLLASSLLAQLSPGPLSSYHAHLEGLSNCTQCHDLGKKVTNTKCLDCHKEIQTRIQAGKGYHASKEVKGKQCASCHNDHHGRNFEIVRFDTTSFDHRLSNYVLEGKHARLACRECHQPSKIKDPEVMKKTFQTYLGLDTKCLSCHDDYHQNTLSVSCTDCHTQDEFKPASKFNHDQSKFPLRGAHKNQECVECHKVSKKNGRDFQQFANVPHQTCTSCHEDVHQGRFGQKCLECHTELSFKTLRSNNRFNHNQTNFPLKGKHEILTCTKCHTEGLRTPLKHERCTDCHEDYHQGDFVDQGVVRSCTDCHSENGFQDSRYSIVDHQLSRFPLEGAHLATPCFSCHRKEDRWMFKKIGLNCKDCHEDVHQASVPEMYFPEANCKACHSAETWHQISFPHEQTGYPLVGAHSKPDCRTCHFDSAKPESFVFQEIKQDCKTCHQDPHQGQFDFYGTQSCLRCHDHVAFKPNQFNHDKTLFPLQGRHREVECAACHKPTEIQGVQVIEYKIKDFRCEACHSS